MARLFFASLFTYISSLKNEEEKNGVKGPETKYWPILFKVQLMLLIFFFFLFRAGVEWAVGIWRSRRAGAVACPTNGRTRGGPGK